ncbi:hypothetical protein [Flagellimonas myxillae]|uniref:hypothetical protein n=1 Tax=Flagellimonas myxillae TaxID=2942214 RepID=UPI00201F17F7|nr:hypothetical protein [Muricauda myxillae]MCL6265502.1 hypothetical protein [Muricauda myxillae]
MKKLSIIVLMLSLGLGSIQNVHAQLGKLGKKVSNKVKMEERKIKKTINNAEKTGKLPKTKTDKISNISKNSNMGTTKTATSSIGIGGEENCKSTEYFFKNARKDLKKIQDDKDGLVDTSPFDMETILERVNNYLEKIRARDPNCDTSKLEGEISDAKNYINEKKGSGTFMEVGTYVTTGIWKKFTIDGAVEFSWDKNKQPFTLEEVDVALKGELSFPSNETKPEYFTFEIKGLGNGVIIPVPTETGSGKIYQWALLNGEEILAIMYLGNNMSEEELKEVVAERTSEGIEQANLSTFTKNNLGKILVSTEGPIYANGKRDGHSSGTDITLTDSFTLGDPLWTRTFVEDHRTPIELLKLTGYPPAGKIGAAIRTRVIFDGKEVGQDFLRCTKPDDVKITNEATNYREAMFKPNGNAQDPYREGFEGIFALNPGYGEHTLEIQKWVVNYNVADTNAGEGENKFPLEVLMATSGELKVQITRDSWKPFCNSGGKNYGAIKGAKNHLASQLLAAVKREASKSGWKEKPQSAVYTETINVYHEITGVFMYSIIQGYITSLMPNGSRLEQGFQMVDGAYHGTIHGTQRYLPPTCK